MTKPSAFNRILRHRWQYIVFLSEFVYMGLELNASRIMSPIFGTTLDIWASIIGTILASSAIGNWIAGRIGDDTRARQEWIPRCLFISALWLALIPLLYAGFMATGINASLPRVMTALLACTVLFMIPGICIGMLSPLVLAQYAHEQKLKIGLASSGFYTAMTLGGLAGTFATGFILVPLFGATNLSVVMASAMGILGLLSTIALSRLKAKEVPIFIITLVVILASMIYINSTPKNTTSLDLWKDTQYGRARVLDLTEGKGRPTRNLLVSGGYESAMYLDDKTKSELVFEYLKTTAKVLEKEVKADDPVLCLGGGAYSFPKYLAYNKQANVDVVEIDGEITTLAKEYFYLDEVSKKSKHQIKTYTGDGRVVLPTLKQRHYSVIFNDTFAGDSPVATLSTIEAVKSAKSVLAPNGIYIMNIIGIQDDANNEFLGWEVKTLREAFGSVRVFSIEDKENTAKDTVQNWVVVATDNVNWQSPKSLYEVKLNLDGAKVLTDDDCPVDFLTARLHLLSD